MIICMHVCLESEINANMQHIPRALHDQVCQISGMRPFSGWLASCQLGAKIARLAGRFPAKCIPVVLLLVDLEMTSDDLQGHPVFS